MQSLIGKSTGDSLTAAEWNQLPAEVQNVIEDLGLTLSSGDLDQLGKAIAGYVANGDFYTDSGVADAYVLGVIGAKQAPTAYTDGMSVRFKAGNANTGAATVNVAGLGVKSIKDAAGAALSAGDIPTTDYSTLTFNLAGDYFVLRKAAAGIQLSDNNVWTGTNAFTKTVYETKGPNVASANDCVLLADGNYNSITGSVTINGFTDGGLSEIRRFHFAGAPLLKHNTAPSVGFSPLSLPGGADIQASVNDEAGFVYDGVNWRCVYYTKADGQAVVSGGGILESVQTFTAGGTWTKPADITKVVVEVQGGGGGGGGGGADAGGGGGGGGYAKELIDVTAISSETVTVGAGGSGGNGVAGSAGGTSSFGAHCSATGGSGGGYSAGADSGGAGGAGSGGDVNITGQGGGASVAAPLSTNCPAGGDGFFAGGGRGTAPGVAAGAGTNGGGGAGGSQVAGGAGGGGIVIVWEYK